MSDSGGLDAATVNLAISLAVGLAGDVVDGPVDAPVDALVDALDQVPFGGLGEARRVVPDW
ncbi:hypothetical protein ACFWHQ_13445 [Streptomyces sp. NPDC060334]|uniref:hypothetical protein n=1 Tax=Streptomyces sp. NPDC060334 TaxID=3347099 RepID=UPI0036619BFA